MPALCGNVFLPLFLSLFVTFDKEEWKRFFRGEFQDNELPRFMIAAVGGFFILLSFALLLYPAELHFSPLTHSVSSLGLYTESPGWFFLSAAMVYSAVTNVPLIKYLDRHLKPILPNTAQIGTRLLLFSNLCLVFVGIFPNTPTFHYLHYYIAFVSFFTWPIGMGAYGVVFVWEIKQNKQNKEEALIRKNKVWPAFAFYGVVIIGMVLSQFIRGLLKIHPYTPSILSYALWEWIWLIMVIVVFNWVVLVIYRMNKTIEDHPDSLTEST